MLQRIISTPSNKSLKSLAPAQVLLHPHPACQKPSSRFAVYLYSSQKLHRTPTKKQTLDGDDASSNRRQTYCFRKYNIEYLFKTIIIIIYIKVTRFGCTWIRVYWFGSVLAGAMVRLWYCCRFLVALALVCEMIKRFGSFCLIISWGLLLKIPLILLITYRPSGFVLLYDVTTGNVLTAMYQFQDVRGCVFFWRWCCHYCTCLRIGVCAIGYVWLQVTYEQQGLH